jgi:hypothetical protein
VNNLSKLFKLLVVVALFATVAPFHVGAESNQVDISGGVKNEYDYEEYVFISGKPVLFQGSGKNIKITAKDSKGKRVTTYTYTLENKTGDKLKRTMTYEADVKDYVLIGQTTQNGSVTKFSEEFTIDNVKYSLIDYQFSNGLTIDNRPASDYYAGNIIARKIYEKQINSRNKERIEVNISSRNEGYNNFWGATEAQITTSEITFANGKVALIENRVSSTKSRTLNYEENSASLSSFLGGYAMNTQAEMVSIYTYNFGDGEQQVESRATYTPVVERLPIPKFRDIANNYSRVAVEQLYSLGVFDEDLEYYSPSLKMQRYEFTIAISKAMNLRVFEEPLDKNTTTLFKDVARSKKDYQYLVAAYEKGVIKGVSATNFSPEGDLTREQAATILIRALGLEDRAADSQSLTKYSDRAKISAYAKASVSEATRIGLLQGHANGTFSPQGKLTRAEAAVVIQRFLEYLNSDLKINYEESNLYFN